ncbi:DUF397 domain-containing protein [Streptomyces marincola]|uniref:DUF397 domain-containing protein n=1 Tax=Streptomyces marincola TaxID=2878388 RepID=A0A1W7D358_9ACTN|nr:DUF397 domain-containing protein [Streptomyces marincola]ARQ71513.1 hypothetical protein CAG99_24175 [Streptomyces marincola]
MVIRGSDALVGANWRTSSYSNDQGGDCVQGACLTEDWFTSRHSNDQGGNCVQGARLTGRAMAVRDSKAPDEATVVFPEHAWTGFVTSLKASPFSSSSK